MGRSVVLGSGGSVIPGGRVIPSAPEDVSIGTGGRMIESVLEGPSVIVTVFEVEPVMSPLDVTPDVMEESDGDELSLIVAESVDVILVLTKDRESVLVSGRRILVSEVDKLSVTPVLEVLIGPVPMREVDEKGPDSTPVPISTGMMLLLFAGIGNGGGFCDSTS